MALFESYERRIEKINSVLSQYGISSVEECREICKAAGFDPYEIVKGIQPICFENACWAYCVGAAIALKKNVQTAAEAAEADFDLKFKEHGFPADAPIFAPDLTPDENGLVYVAKILVDAGVAGTASEARRLIDGGGVKVNGEALAPKAYNVAPEVLAGAEVQVGKKKFVRFE